MVRYFKLPYSSPFRRVERREEQTTSDFLANSLEKETYWRWQFSGQRIVSFFQLCLRYIYHWKHLQSLQISHTRASNRYVVLTSKLKIFFSTKVACSWQLSKSNILLLHRITKKIQLGWSSYLICRYPFMRTGSLCCNWWRLKNAVRPA